MRVARYWPSAESSNRLGRPAASQCSQCATMTGSVHRARDAGDRRRLGKSPAQFRMVAAAMVAFAVVLPDQLPVAVLDDRALERDLGLGQPMRRQIGFDAWRGTPRSRAPAWRGRSRYSRRRSRNAPASARGALASKSGAHVAGIAQPAVEFVGPVVIGADELDDASLRRGADPRAAVAAGIVESADRAVVGRARPRSDIRRPAE